MESMWCRMFAITIAIFLILWAEVNGDICEQCVCSKFECESVIKNCSINEIDINCDGKNDKLRKTNQSISLETIQWPRRNITISAKLNYLNVTFLPKVLCTAPATSLSLAAINLDDNLIEYIANDPFQFCPDLTHISFARNKINRLSLDMFKSTPLLERLNLSYNSLSDFDSKLLSQCKQLIELNLSHNQITTLKINEILDASPRIEVLNAAFNNLFAISDNNLQKYLSLKQLNLAGNRMTVIISNTFKSYPKLQILNVSSNFLANIENDAFEKLEYLKILDLSMNNLKDLSLDLPDSLEYLSIASNQLKYWPISISPQHLTELQLQENQLEEIFNIASRKKFEFTSLISFNVSYNQIRQLPPGLLYPKLHVFDASFNRFSNIPQYLGAQAPEIEILRFRGNPIERIDFATKMSAQIVDLSYSPLLTHVDASQFNFLAPKSGCVELSISHSPKLREISDSFLNVPSLCRLDLSYNNLSILDHNWANWSSLDKGIDFQGNPIDCSCVSQWIVDFFIPILHNQTEHWKYLYEFRCATPQRFKGNRILRYLNHQDAFCTEKINRLQVSQFRVLPDIDQEPFMLTDFRLIVITILLLIIVTVSISIVIILVKRKRSAKRKNRRFYNNGEL